jgi:hypothetical protein
MSWSDRPDDPLPPDHPERDRGRSHSLASVAASTQLLIGSMIALAAQRRGDYPRPGGDGDRSRAE